jgi:hypothetical protein
MRFGLRCSGWAESVGFVRFAQVFRCRGRPAGGILSLYGLKKSIQRKPPHSTALRFATGPLRCSPNRAAAKLALRAQTVLAEIPRLVCATRRQSKGTEKPTQPRPTQPSPQGGYPKHGLRPQNPNPPLHRLGFPKRSGAVGEDCLRPQAEFRSRPIFSENRGKPEGPVRVGALLFGYLYFGQCKIKVTCCRAAQAPKQLREAHTKPTQLETTRPKTYSGPIVIIIQGSGLVIPHFMAVESILKTRG